MTIRTEINESENKCALEESNRPKSVLWKRLIKWKTDQVKRENSKYKYKEWKW